MGWRMGMGMWIGCLEDKHKMVLKLDGRLVCHLSAGWIFSGLPVLETGEASLLTCLA